MRLPLIVCWLFLFLVQGRSATDCEGKQCAATKDGGLHLVQKGHRRSQCEGGVDTAQSNNSTAQCEDWCSFTDFPAPQGTLAPVTLNNGRYVVMSGLKMGMLVIEENAELHFHQDFSGQFEVTEIHVRGKLIMGTSTCPLTGPARIVFSGESKMLEVDHGATWIMHGKPYLPTWVRLSQSANKDDTKIRLQSAVDWEPGQHILLVTTVMLDVPSSHQNEDRRIEAVEDGGKTLVLDQPLQYLHYAGEEYQGEVALLSRSIVIQGDEASEDTKKGANTMCKRGATCQLSYAQAFRAGQFNVVGRYPFHFHMMKNIQQNSFFHGISVYKSYFRAFTIHGTSGATLSNSVAYDITGTAVYMEDASEEDCIVKENLIAFVHRIKPLDTWRLGKGEGREYYIFPEPDRTEPIDETAAGFYCPNPKNTWIGNVASGGFAGFIFVATRTVTGLSSLDDELKRKTPLANDVQVFKGNTAHSSGSEWNQGACMYFGGDVMLQRQNGKLVKTYSWGRVPVIRGRGTLENTLFYACRFGFEVWGPKSDKRPQITMIDTTSADVMTSVRLLGMNAVQGGTVYGRTANTRVFDGVQWHTENGNPPPRGTNQPWGVNGILLYDTLAQTIVQNLTFKNFDGPNDAAILQPIMYNDFTTQGLPVFDGTKFENVPYKNKLVLNRGFSHCQGNQKTCHSSQNGNVIDLDGAISGDGVPSLIGVGNDICRNQCMTNDWWKLDDDCKQVFPESWPSGRSGGWWACPLQSINSWARTEEPRHVVSLVLAATLRMNRWSRPFLNEEGRRMRGSAVKHPPKNLDTLPTGLIYHFGKDDRRLSIGFPLRYREDEARDCAFTATGPCCDVGWYFYPQKGGQDGNAFGELAVYMDQMGPNGLIFAAAFPKSAQLTITREFGFPGEDHKKETIVRTTCKRTFMAQPGTAYFLDTETGNVFLKLANPSAEKFDMGDGAWEYQNHFLDQARYMIKASNVGGKASFALPARDWIAQAQAQEC